MGLSIDAEYNRFNGETVDANFMGGIFDKGDTDLENWAIEGGFMIMPKILEVVVGFESQDTENYTDPWTRLSFGLNWFIKEHDIKIQATYRMGENLNGLIDNDENELFMQAQYIF